MIERAMARMIPCSTPTMTTVAAVMAATTNSPWPEPIDVGHALESTSRTPMRKTTAARTAFGM